MFEVETKVLGVDKDVVIKRLLGLGAVKVLDTRLFVRWFKLTTVPVDGLPWYLRIRSDSDGNSEVTWKGKEEFTEFSRKHKEINFKVDDPEVYASLFESIGLEVYGVQEKDRVSFKLKDWRFDLDTYPGMPTYLEIEGSDEQHILEAIELLGLGDKERTSVGETLLILNKYRLDWFKMKF